MSFWPPAAADARRQAVNAMVLMDGGNPVREAANQMFADGLQLADTLQASGGLPPTTSRVPQHLARQPAARSGAADSRPLADGAGPPGVLLLDRRVRYAQRADGHARQPAARPVAGAVGVCDGHAGPGTGRQGHHLHAVGVQPDDADQRHRHATTRGAATRSCSAARCRAASTARCRTSCSAATTTPAIAACGFRPSARSQFGATLGRWFGATPGRAGVGVPATSANFSTPDLGFMRS